MSKQKNTSIGFAKSRKFVAFLFLLFFTLQFFSPVVLISTPVARAAGCSGGSCGGSASTAGGLGGLLGGGSGGSMLEMAGMLMGLLMQLFQGGNTPQQGRAEENPGQWASGQERFTSGLQNQNYGSNTANVYNPASIPSTSLVVGSGMTLPSSLQLARGGAITISNANTTPTNIEIRRAGDNTSASITTLNSGDTKVFRFSNAGNYRLCTSSATNTCNTNIVVSN